MRLRLRDGDHDGVTRAFAGLASVIKAPLRALGAFLAGIPTSVMGIEIPGADTLRSWGEQLRGLRGGGAIRTRHGLLRGPGTGTSDSILGVNGRGVPVVRVSDGEGVVRADVMARGGAAIVAALNSGHFPGLATGGVIEEAVRFAQQAGNGRRYVYGGTGPSGWDCSGFMSSIYAILTGRDPFKRWFTTESDFEALGFQKGYMPGAFNIGIRRGGGGQNSHMAGTLPNGVNVESGGKDGTTKYGGNAAGALDFPIRYFLPLSGNPLTGVVGAGSGLGSAVSYSGGGSGGGMSAVERDRKITEKEARLAQLEQELAIAEQALAEAGANDKTKESTLMSKQLAVQKKHDAIAKLQQEIDDLRNAPVGDGYGLGGGRGSGGNNPFSKILDGFGELAQTGVDGIIESFLPPGFDNPLEWGLPKMVGGVLNFVSGLIPDPVARGVLGAVGAGITGDARGAASSLAEAFRPPESEIAPGDPGAFNGVGYGDMGGAFDQGAPGLAEGATIDQSINNTFSGPVNYEAVQIRQTADQNRQLRRPFGTNRMIPA